MPRTVLEVNSLEMCLVRPSNRIVSVRWVPSQFSMLPQMAVANSCVIDGRTTIFSHCMANLTVYLLESANLRSADRHLRYPGILRIPYTQGTRGRSLWWIHSRGLNSFTSQLNLSASYGIGGARKDCVARVKGVLGGVYGVWGAFVCQTRPKLS